MSKQRKYEKQLKMRLTEEQRMIIAKVPYAHTKIRNFITNLKPEKYDTRRNHNYSLNLTAEHWEKLEAVTNKSELIRHFIDTKLREQL